MMQGDGFSVGLVQMRSGDDREGNLARATTLIEDAAAQGAEILCLPELFGCLYPCQREDVSRFDLAEPVPGPTTEALARVAREREVVIVAPLFEKRAEGVFHNSAVVIDADGSVLGLYRKMHIPDDPLYYEKFYFSPGDLGFRSFDTRYGHVGVLICWDQWFPEAARLTALAGAEIVLCPSAIGWESDDPAEVRREQREAWRIAQRAHAVANGAFVAAVNRVGVEGDIEFWGSSFVSDPFGAVVAAAGAEEEIVVVQCERRRIKEIRRAWPFLRDRRVDAYGSLCKRFLR